MLIKTCPIALTKAYATPYVGTAASDFIKYIRDREAEQDPQLYAKAIPVVQSSGTGKSRMLSEVRLSTFSIR